MNAEVLAVARRWLFKAGEDLLAGSRLVEEGIALGPACYDLEQAAERYMKALMTVEGIAAPRTHDLAHFNTLLPEGKRLDVPLADLTYLSAYGIDSWWEPDFEQARRAVQVASRIRDAVVALLPRTVFEAESPFLPEARISA